MLAFARTAHGDEQAHVDTLKRTLGGRAVKQPRFDFMDATRLAGRVPQNGADAGGHRRLRLPGTGARDQPPETCSRRPAAILAVEARHAAWVADLIGRGADPSPAPDAFSARARRPNAVLARRQKNRLHPMRRTRPMADTYPTLDQLDRDGALREAGVPRRPGHARLVPAPRARDRRRRRRGRRRAAGALPRRRACAERQRRRHPQLRADARVPRGGLLRRGGRQRRAQRRAGDVRENRLRARAGARRGAAERRSAARR